MVFLASVAGSWPAFQACLCFAVWGGTAPHATELWADFPYLLIPYKTVWVAIALILIWTWSFTISAFCKAKDELLQNARLDMDSLKNKGF